MDNPGLPGGGPSGRRPLSLRGGPVAPLKRSAKGVRSRRPQPPRAPPGVRVCLLLAALGLGGVGSLPADVAGGPATGPVHTRLRSSVPADGDTLRRAPSSLRLTFTQAVEADLAEVRLGGSGGEPLDLEMETDSRDPATLTTSLPLLRDGAYRVTWSVLSADGHRVEGSFVFWILAPEAADSAAVAPPPPAGSTPGPAWESPRSPPVLLSALRGAADFALLGWAGILLFLAWPGTDGSEATRRIGTAAAIGASGLLLLHALAWAAHTAGPGTPVPEWLALFGETLPGRVVATRLTLVFLALWAFALARRHGLALLFAWAAVVTGAGLGHAAVVEPLGSVPAKAIHLLAASVWLGGLVFLATAPRDGADFRDAARRVSSLALAAVVAIALTGVVQVWLFMPAPLEGLSTGYGLLVLLKIAGLLVLVGFGAFNRLRLLPALPAEREGRALRRSVRREIVVVLLVVLVAGVLANVSPPAAAGDGTMPEATTTADPVDGGVLP